MFVSDKTAIGWWKEPIKFFPKIEFIPVLPPIELSTWESIVVGIWIKLIPLNKTEATKPVRSPITPPPKAISMDFLSMPVFIIFSHKKF